ncbi:sensor histidine kinase [Arcanobacterium hippocoleae]|uniref:sensor histidine kinase n=1 Tax=Arcanobacterium hippocoleae TaxID=149017 RepID=UPI003341A6AC
MQEIIQLSRLQETDALSDPQVVSIDGVVDEALARIEVVAKSRQITLSRGGEHGLEVYGDYSLLMTAVRNLLDNAVRYSKAYSRVSVGISSTRNAVSIAVVDAGQGIPQELHDRVFERFFRGDSARSRETGGSGLGLSIVKHVVQDHGGKVHLWSQEGRGSTFTIELPKIYEQNQKAQPSAAISQSDIAEGMVTISLTQTEASRQDRSAQNVAIEVNRK